MNEGKPYCFDGFKRFIGQVGHDSSLWIVQLTALSSEGNHGNRDRSYSNRDRPQLRILFIYPKQDKQP